MRVQFQFNGAWEEAGGRGAHASFDPTRHVKLTGLAGPWAATRWRSGARGVAHEAAGAGLGGTCSRCAGAAPAGPPVRG